MPAANQFPIPQAKQTVYWPDLSAGSLTLLLRQHLPAQDIKIILTSDTEQAIRIQSAWQFFDPAARVVFFPDWETLPYEHFSPHQELVSERLSTLWQLKNGLVDVLLLPLATAMQKIAPPSFILGRTFWLKTGQQLDVDALRNSLIEIGRAHV